MRKLALMGTFVAVVAFGCKDDDPQVVDPPVPVPTLKVTSTLSGASVVPANTSTGEGSVEGTLDQESRILSLNITYSDSAAADSSSADSLFLPTGWHIHMASVDTTGAEVFDLGTEFTKPFAFKDTLTEQEFADLKAGLYYIDIHTARYPEGEIRGQLKAEE